MTVREAIEKLQAQLAEESEKDSDLKADYRRELTKVMQVQKIKKEKEREKDAIIEQMRGKLADI